MTQSQPELISHFALLADNDNIYKKVRENLITSNAATAQIDYKCDLFVQQNILSLFTDSFGIYNKVSPVLLKYRLPLLLWCEQYTNQ